MDSVCTTGKEVNSTPVKHRENMSAKSVPNMNEWNKYITCDMCGGTPCSWMQLGQEVVSKVCQHFKMAKRSDFSSNEIRKKA